MSKARDCPICGDFNQDAETSGIARAYGADALRRIRLFERDGLVLFVPVAPLVSGYLMIAPERHTETTLLVDPASPATLLANETANSLAAIYGSAWYFEHVSKSTEGTSCVPHSHVHVSPGSPPSSLFCQAELLPLSDPGVDIVVGSAKTQLALAVKTRYRQYVRRHISESQNGIPVWDWRLVRHSANFHATSKALPLIASRIPKLLEKGSASRLLVLAGQSGCGKSAIAQSLSSLLHLQVSEMGQEVRNRHQTANSNLPLVDFADFTFRTEGAHTFVREVSNRVPPLDDHILVGPRRPEELQYLAANHLNLALIWVDAPRSDRKSRRTASPDDLRYFAHRDELETDWGLLELREMADLRVANEQKTLEELAKEIAQWWLRR